MMPPIIIPIYSLDRPIPGWPTAVNGCTPEMAAIAGRAREKRESSSLRRPPAAAQTGDIGGRGRFQTPLFMLLPKLIGYAICFYSYSTWQGKSLALEDIYIRPQYRRHGYGEHFFKALARHARDNHCSRIDFHVLDWNPATSFYRRMGALDLTEAESWHFYRLPKDAIVALCDE
ncbi:thialysine N-epsilon-acetyltransferase isoform X2 [Anopheles cruzii]|uniref:thialysine N-epsilon-acetyltransferase isoform X2 n=1 Tax=Anopheles cruzii TaxID=68878 RepID=UPI0022EC7AEC|nr:thialysine N-epsilon-acetyltransferase isoform X2 [Anopheles cruzii]